MVEMDSRIDQLQADLIPTEFNIHFTIHARQTRTKTTNFAYGYLGMQLFQKGGWTCFRQDLLILLGFAEKWENAS